MRRCRECGKPVEAHAQFCPWCFAFPGTAGVEEPAPAAVAATVPAPPAVERSSTVVFSSGPVRASVWPRVAMAGGTLAIVVALVVGVLAFRGGDGGERVPAGEPAASPQDVVDRAVLRAEDLGPGWSVSTAPDAPTTPDGGALAACLGVPFATPTAEAVGAFENADLLTVGGSASYWADAEQARAQVDKAAHPKLEECSEAQAGGLVDMALERSSLPERPGALVRTRIPIEGTDTTLHVDTVSVARDRVTVSVFAVWNQPVPEDLLLRAADAMLGRV